MYTVQEEDVRRPPLQLSTLGDIKHFMYYVNSLKGTQKILNQVKFNLFILILLLLLPLFNLNII